MSNQTAPGVEAEKISSRAESLTWIVRRYFTFMVRYEIWIVAPLVAATMLSARLLPVAVGAALLFWLMRWLGTGKLTVRTPIDLPVAFLLLVLPIVMIVTAIPEKTIPQILRLISGIALFYAIVNWSTSQFRLRLIVTGIIAAGFVLVIMSPISVTWVVDSKLPFLPISIYDRFSILVSDTVHPNVMAGNLAMFFPITIGLLTFSWKWLSRLERSWTLVVALSIGAVVVLTKSRGAWLSLVVVLMLIALLRWRKWSLLGLLIPLGVFVYYGLSSPALEMLASADALGGIQGRFEIASRAIYMIRDFPFTGIGMGSFSEVADLLYPFFLFPPEEIVHAHNLFLQIGVDLGLPGLIAWLSIFLLVIFCSIRIYSLGRLMNNGWYAGLGAGLLGSHLALTVHGLTDAVTWGMVRPAPLVWVIWGLAVSLLNVQMQSKEILLTE
jgi:putative inorganic carbon (hco3(-)) transporter